MINFERILFLGLNILQFSFVCNLNHLCFAVIFFIFLHLKYRLKFGQKSGILCQITTLSFWWAVDESFFTELHVNGWTEIFIRFNCSEVTFKTSLKYYFSPKTLLKLVPNKGYSFRSKRAFKSAFIISRLPGQKGIDRFQHLFHWSEFSLS